MEIEQISEPNVGITFNNENLVRTWRASGTKAAIVNSIRVKKGVIPATGKIEFKNFDGIVEWTEDISLLEYFNTQFKKPIAVPKNARIMTLTVGQEKDIFEFVISFGFEPA